MEDALKQVITRYPDLHHCYSDIERAFAALKHCFESGGKLLVCGNGGSASDSDHIVGELMKGFVFKRPLPPSVKEQYRAEFGEEGQRISELLQGALPAISLTNHATLTSAIANDTDAAMVYAQQVYGYGRRGDVLLGISTSGQSTNVIRAVQVARMQGMVTIALTGAAGGRLAELCDVAIRVPYNQTSEIQERHLPIYHALCIALEEVFFTK